MTPFLASHVPPAIAVFGGVIVMLSVAWYWRRLDAPDVPETRRRIRRASMIVMLIATPLFVYGAGFADHRADPQRYAVIWAGAISLLLLVIFAAFIDMLNNLRIHRADAARAGAMTRAALIDAARQIAAARAAAASGGGSVDAPADGPAESTPPSPPREPRS
ncbi:MAG: hypothetical protein HRU76_03740 [Phycisphaeraceae bacterium]|nr:hypothetical protein [Phycisphaerales bacterium]QOJ16749.1 MAG: hypothetical protein HRU76_03740 [Phycisphaeraceae bacterium]